ncbi:MAG: hypothetical protein R3E89_15610 [Thiolinea sp.]
MSTKTLNDLVSEFEEVQALLEVTDMALRQMKLCEGIPLEKTLRIAGGFMDSALSELRELAAKEVQE